MCEGACMCEACCARAREFAFADQHLDTLTTRDGHWRYVSDGRVPLLDGRRKAVLRRDGGDAG